MEKRKTTIIFTIGVMLIVSTFLICHKHTVYQTQLDEVKLKDVVNKEQNNMFAIMLQDENGEYKQTNDSNFPTDGYNYNAEKSGCIDSKGLAVENVLTYTNKKFSVRTNKAVYCYVYFDKSNAEELLEQLKKSGGLSDAPVGGMYRYQGTNAQVNNYLCLEGKCSSGSDDMYRIIGVTPEGNIKVIKQTRYGSTHAWNTKYSDASSPTNIYCGTSGCPEWPNSDIYKELNTNNDSFLNKLSNKIQDKIEEWDWWYGDIEYNYAKNLTGENLYQIETGGEDSQYYSKTQTGQSIQTGPWQKMSNKAKIGLIYLHDYYYQTTTSTNCHLSSSTYTQCLNNGWMHMLNNEGATSYNEQYEWTMTRVGRENNSSTDFRAWFVSRNGEVSTQSLNSSYAIRPVFYLKNNITLYGSGTVNDPFRLTEPTEQENTLRSKDTTQALSQTLVGGMYRYQGTNNVVKNNYICLGSLNDINCGDKSNEMYRIIGITPEGNIKVIKQTRYQKGSTSGFAWNTAYNASSSANSTDRCDTNNGCPEWPQAEIYNTLNTDFYNSLNSEIKGKIEEWNYMYGDISHDLVNSDHITAEQAYKIESGQENTKYWEHPSVSYIENTKWTKSQPSKIALMYIHDYAYSGSTTGHETSCRTDYDTTCKGSWMHETNNDSNTYHEWTMSRLGRASSSSATFGAWVVLSSGQVDSPYLTNTRAVRPVFYLTSDIELGGAGSTSDPFYIAN